MSYAHEYCLPGGKKSMLAYSRPFSLARYAPKRWVIAPDDLDWLLEALDASPHVPVAPHGMRCASGGARRRSNCARKRCWNGPTRAKLKRKRNTALRGLTIGARGARDLFRHYAQYAARHEAGGNTAWRLSPSADN